jgi:L-lactate dehydrogenase (cytochrome)
MRVLTSARMPVVTNIADLRRMAQRRVAKAVFDYVDRGSYDEQTMRANRADLEALHFRQRVAIDVDQRSTRSTMAGQAVTMPVAIAPVGLTGLNWADGEILGARAAGKFGIPFTLSTMSICSIEDVANEVAQPFWYQLYVFRDRGFAASLIERAKAAKCSALVMTLDLQIQGQRHMDLKNGLTVPPRLTPGTVLDVMTKPGWVMNVLTGRRKSFGNLEGRIPDANTLATLGQWIAGQFDPTLSWKDVEWVKNLWGGKLILKGILDPEDAKIAASTGADAIVVSNHGGRQLDGTVSSIRALPEVVQAVGGRTEVWFDGGILSGQDVLRALALGAQGTMIGKAFAYGLGAMGEAGVTKTLEILQKELDVTMALCGLKDVKDASPAILRGA